VFQPTLPEEPSNKQIAILNRRLADGTDLTLQARQAHWLLKSSTFSELSTQFDQISQELKEHVDLIAERIVQLGGVPEGTARVIVTRTSLSDYPVLTVTEQEHLIALVKVLDIFDKHIRYTGEYVAKLADTDSVALLTDISRSINVWLRVLEAHRQGTP